MYEYIKITDAELDALPPGLAGFVAYEALCRDRLRDCLRDYGQNDDETEPRQSYLTKVLSAAEHYHVPVLEEVEFEINGNYDGNYERRLFQMIEKETNKLRFQTISARKGTAVIETPQALKIEHHISQLRVRITESELEDRIKSKLYRKLDEILSILKGKPTLQATMLVIASFFTAINQAEAAIIRLPETMSAIAEIFGHAQEEAETKALEHMPQKLIEDQTEDRYDAGLSTKPKQTPRKSAPRESYDLNDDIPF
ncbi:MAG: hypothetical protein EON87_11285 [Brevundimonas sp.]|nr:MAG: hypothetical protein EON87_11285 [Brevundimonas sp.]